MGFHEKFSYAIAKRHLILSELYFCKATKPIVDGWLKKKIMQSNNIVFLFLILNTIIET